MISKRSFLNFLKKVLEERIRIIFVLVTIFLLLFAIAVNAKEVFLEKEIKITGTEKNDVLFLEYEAVPFSSIVLISTDTQNIPCLKIASAIEKKLCLEQNFYHTEEKKISKAENIFFDIKIKVETECSNCFLISIKSFPETGEFTSPETKCYFGDAYEINHHIIPEINKFIFHILKDKSKMWKIDHHALMIQKIINAFPKEHRKDLLYFFSENTIKSKIIFLENRM